MPKKSKLLEVDEALAIAETHTKKAGVIYRLVERIRFLQPLVNCQRGTQRWTTCSTMTGCRYHLIQLAEERKREIERLLKKAKK